MRDNKRTQRGQRRRKQRSTRRKQLYRKRLQRGGEEPTKEPGTVILVEPRKHKALVFVVKNLMENLGPEWKMILFHGTENEEWVKKKMEEEWTSFKDRITLNNLGTAKLAYPEDYNKLFTSKEFHEKIPTELFLVAQTDSMICPQYKDILNKFLQYDYVGAPWPWIPAIGNGGFSLRRKSKMLEIINKFPWESGKSPNEDIYFASHFSETNTKLPSVEEAKEFSIEVLQSPKSFGVHKPWGYGVNISEEQCRGYTILKDLQRVE